MMTDLLSTSNKFIRETPALPVEPALEPGRYTFMPSRYVHQFRCEKACSFYVHSDAAFDIHYVDAQGKRFQ